MRLGGRAQAAIEVLEAIEGQHKPVGVALKDWGSSHRFAGSGDRSAIGNLVYDTLRKSASHAHLMGDESPRARVLSTLVRDWGLSVDSLSTTFEEDHHAPSVPSEKEAELLLSGVDDPIPAWAEANVPEWLWPIFEDNYEDHALNEGQALAQRPPLDMRVNALKANPDKVVNALKRQGAKKSPISLNGVRIKAGEGDRRLPNVQADAAFQKGWFEVQDEGSQIVSELVLAQPGEQILDFCAGAGGKTLALSALMGNKGQVHAFDIDRHRLAPIHERIKRAGARNIQVHAPNLADLANLKGKMDRVIVDAPCTGSGVWRRHPDAKWKLTQQALEDRLDEQEQVLDQASAFVKPGGFLIYITCSVLGPENEGQVYPFIERSKGFELLSAGEAWEDLYGYDKLKPWSSDGCTVTLTPASTGTDGFFFAVFERTA